MIQRGILTDKNTKVGMTKIYSFYAILSVHVCIIKHADIYIINSLNGRYRHANAITLFLFMFKVTVIAGIINAVLFCSKWVGFIAPVTEGLFSRHSAIGGPLKRPRSICTLIGTRFKGACHSLHTSAVFEVCSERRVAAGGQTPQATLYIENAFK